MNDFQVFFFFFEICLLPIVDLKRGLHSPWRIFSLLAVRYCLLTFAVIFQN